MPKHDDKFAEYFENQEISHAFHDPMAVFMEELSIIEFKLWLCCENKPYNKFPMPLQVLVLILLKHCQGAQVWEQIFDWLY